VNLMCQVLKVTRSGFYAWRNRPASARSKRRQQLIERIKSVHETSRRTYGSPRIAAELKASDDVVACENTVAKYMRIAGICASRKKRFVPCTTNSNHPHPIAPNRLDRDFSAPKPNTKWCGDITYIWTAQGWLYLAVMLDLFSRRVVGWSMTDNLKTDIVAEALMMALTRRRPDGTQLLHHSDRGVQYACNRYKALLAAAGITASMSRSGNCYDNAVAESFFGTLKTEHVNQQNYQTRDQAKTSVFEWIEVFYNRQRRHSSLGYLSPEAFEAQIQ